MGYWIILKGPEGERKVAEGQPYRLLRGEAIIGTQQDEAVAQYVNTSPAADLVAEIESELNTNGKGVGDWTKRLLKPVALLLGKANCMSCEARRLVLNAVTKLTEKHGKVQTKVLVKELLSQSLKDSPEVILTRLKELL